MPGLTSAEARLRLAQHGPNALPAPGSTPLPLVFLRQFLSPLIYILLAAAVVSLVLSDPQDALFIAIVLLANGIIGTVQEYSAGRAADSLRKLEQPRALVVRDGMRTEIDGRDLVPGDLVLLESGAGVPADLRIVEAIDLRCDESLLTGESDAVEKQPALHDDDTANACLAFAGTMIVRGRGAGIAIRTGPATEIGKIAHEIGKRRLVQPPLLIRMERFARMIAYAVGLSLVLLVAVGLVRGLGWTELFMMSVGLAVSAIPEGLPVAISIALAIGMRRMARANVVVRKLAAVESLGSCTMIATDKTGTLTLNQLTVTKVLLPDGTEVEFEAGSDLDRCAVRGGPGDETELRARLASLLRAAALPNEGRLVRKGDGWIGGGDTVDVALLAASHKGGLRHPELQERYPVLGRIPYEPDQRYAASFHTGAHNVLILVKGAPETLIAMADRMRLGPDDSVPLDREVLLRQKEAMAEAGLRVLAFAEGEIEIQADGTYGPDHLANLTFLGFAGMQDPVRPEVPAAIATCHSAGIEVAMITGDDPRTAFAIAVQAGLDIAEDQVVTGAGVAQATAEGEQALDALTARARLYARVDPMQKLAIVQSLARNGHFVAVTGDGVNDAPALRQAHVGVAMGLRGTEVAKESADIIITDDNFASIVHGIREGRISYANIRKVIFMVMSTGAAEVVLFLLALPLGTPMPLLPVQLLWLNLVTNGIQDVSLAAERAEGDELSRRPRRPDEPIFDRMMIRRILHSTLIMGVGGFALFYWLLTQGYGEDAARNQLLLLLVMFENFQTYIARSERRPLHRQNLFSNPLLLLGVLGAQGLHVAAMHLPGVSDMLHLSPVGLTEWIALLLLASTILFVMEAEKWWDRRPENGLSAGNGASR